MLKSLWHKLPFTGEQKPFLTTVRLSGVIATGKRGGGVLNLSVVDKALKKAFAREEAKAVVLIINSPGGSPVQSDILLERIREHAEKTKIPVISYIEDVGASGGYMIALAGEEIFANPYAIVGSIGVISSSFGLNNAISKLGIERRVYTAGENKSQLDPFLPENADDVSRLSGILDQSHELFSASVRARRGERLTGEDADLFSGNFWIASDAKDRGLIDETGNLRTILKARFGDDIEIQNIAVDRGSPLLRLLDGRAPSPGVGVDSEEIAGGLQNVLHWARFGK